MSEYGGVDESRVTIAKPFSKVGSWKIKPLANVFQGNDDPLGIMYFG